jgi:hypothetical protein
MAEDAAVSESRSSVKIGQTAKGEPVVEVKVYAAEAGWTSAAEAQAQAVALFKKTVVEVNS